MSPVFQHGKNAFLALGYDAPGIDAMTMAVSVDGGNSILTGTIPTGSLLSSGNPVVNGVETYGVFANDCPAWGVAAPTQGSSGDFTLAGQLVSGVTSGDVAVTPMINVSPYINDIGFPQAIDNPETTTFSREGVKTYIVGLKGYSISFSGHYDPSLSTTGTTGGIDQIMDDLIKWQDAGNFIRFVYGPASPGGFGGQNASLFYYGRGVLGKYDLKSSVSGIIEFDSEIQVSGAVSRIPSL